MPASFANRPVSLRVYPERIVVAAEGQVVCEHRRVFARSHDRQSAMIYDFSFGEWASVFGDAKMTTALLDRLTHRCHIVETGNDSFRFKTSSAKLAKSAKEKARNLTTT